MMNDYDTRRGLEAAAMAGDKDAKKLPRQGFKNFKSYGCSRTFQKEYVGGGGMDWP